MAKDRPVRIRGPIKNKKGTEMMHELSQLAINRIGMLLIAALTDLVIGDPQQMWHPVQGVGFVIDRAQKMLRVLLRIPVREASDAQGGTNTGADTEPPQRHAARERIAGGILVLIVLAVSTGTVVILLRLCGRIHPFLRLLAEGVLCGRLLALRSLGEAGVSVRDPLMRGETKKARRAVSMIVGRDTDRLDDEGIAKAAVETVAENTSDGVTAPFFYMILFGGAGGMFYKAVNTMDSMVGYKNSEYRYLGTAAARLDDVMNFVPSRITALMMIAACLIPPHRQVQTMTVPDAAAAWRIWRRDRLKSESPNSAQTESVCAGALHLRLLGDARYFGELHHKKEIGDGGRRVEPEDITRAVRLMYYTAAEMFVTALVVLFVLAL